MSISNCHLDKRSHRGCLALFALALFFVAATPVIADTTTQEASPADKLLQLAGKHFNGLTPGEEKLFRAAANGETADYRTGSEYDDNPTNAVAWPANRIIQADRIIWLCTDPEATRFITFRGLAITGAKIDGELNLKWAVVRFPVSVANCAFTKNIVLANCRIYGLCLDGSRIQNLRAAELRVDGDVLLRDGFQAGGEVNLSKAFIVGDLDCSGGKFVEGDDDDGALDADQARIEGSVYLRDDDSGLFTATGTVNFSAVNIRGDLDCSGGKFVESEDDDSSLDAEAARITGNVFLGNYGTNRFSAMGEVDLAGASIGGDLDCSAGRFIGLKAKQTALDATAASIRQRVFMCSTAAGYFLAEGGVDFHGASVGGNFNCFGGQFINPAGRALDASESTITASAFLNQGFGSQGEVNFSDAAIRGSLDFSSSQLVGSNNYTAALRAEGVKIGGSLLLSSGFKALGAVDLYSATIGEDLDCSWGRLLNHGTNGYALMAQRTKIDGSIFMRGEFEAAGHLDFIGSTVARGFEWRPAKPQLDAILDLRFSKIGILVDDASTWPATNNLYLDGFVYDEIAQNSPTDVASRLAWLGRQPATVFVSQPYEQLAAIYRGLGQEEKVVKVMIAKNHDYAARLSWSSPSEWSDCFWYKIFGNFIGYGYKTWRALALSLFFILAGTFIFRLGHRRHLILPADEKAYSFNNEVLEVNISHPAFNHFIYSLEMFVPLVKLGVGDCWRPSAERGRPLFNIRRKTKTMLTTDGLLRCYVWIHILAGWVLTTLWVGGLTGLVKT